MPLSKRIGRRHTDHSKVNTRFILANWAISRHLLAMIASSLSSLKGNRQKTFSMPCHRTISRHAVAKRVPVAAAREMSGVLSIPEMDIPATSGSISRRVGVLLVASAEKSVFRLLPDHGLHGRAAYLCRLLRLRHLLMREATKTPKIAGNERVLTEVTECNERP